MLRFTFRYMGMIFLSLIRTLIVHFHGRLNPEQMYSSENSTTSRSHSPGERNPPVSPSLPSNISDGTRVGGPDALA